MKKKVKKSIKPCKSYKISVEGINCEVLYFEHLQELINEYDAAEYKVNFYVKKKNPLSFAKSRITAFSKKNKKNDYIKFIHVQDIEDYYDAYQRQKFEDLIDEIEVAKKECKISTYDLAYSNYTFDLWMVLHKYNLTIQLTDRTKYYPYINIGYNKKYQHMDDYKSEKEFKSILEQIQIEDVLIAIERAHKIRNNHIANAHHIETHNGFSYYRDNPDLNIHFIIEEIFRDCGIIK